MMISCRKWLLLGLAPLGLAGCATSSAPAPEQTYCHKNMPQRERVCTSGAVPDPRQDAEAKKFLPQPGIFMLYIVRRNPVDNYHRISVSVDGYLPLETIPQSFIQVQLKPGTHTLSFTSDRRTYQTTVEGKEGEVGFAGLVRNELPWFEQDGWSQYDAELLRSRTRSARLIGKASY